jgi:hypothetical protein
MQRALMNDVGFTGLRVNCHAAARSEAPLPRSMISLGKIHLAPLRFSNASKSLRKHVLHDEMRAFPNNQRRIFCGCSIEWNAQYELVRLAEMAALCWSLAMKSIHMGGITREAEFVLRLALLRISLRVTWKADRKLAPVPQAIEAELLIEKINCFARKRRPSL